MKSSVQSSAAVALMLLLGSITTHAATSSSAPAYRGAPFDDRPAGSLLAPYTGMAAPSGGLIASFVSVVSGSPDAGAAATPVAGPSLFPPFASAAADAAEARSFTGGTGAASLYTLIASGIGNASTGAYLDGTPIAAAAPPQAYALLLAGLLAIGFILRRRFD